jgi:acyl carrier protein
MDRSQLREELLDLLELTTGSRPPALNDQDKLREALNLDSLDFVSLIIEIQARHAIDIRNEELASLNVAGDLLDMIQAKIAKGAENKAA